jgi:Uma2 family endonuclease
MYAVISKDRIQLPPGTVVHMPGSWQDYLAICVGRGDSSIPRIKYSNGGIALMSPLPQHGRKANILADIVKAILSSQNRNYEAFTPITMELTGWSGVEPDYCFYIDNWPSVVGKDRIDWVVDPPPDLAIEVDVTSYTNILDFLPYKVPEVWLLKADQLDIYHLQSESYVSQLTSQYFPGIDIKSLTAQCFETAKEKGTGTAMSELRQHLMGST